MENEEAKHKSTGLIWVLEDVNFQYKAPPPMEQRNESSLQKATKSNDIVSTNNPKIELIFKGLKDFMMQQAKVLYGKTSTKGVEIFLLQYIPSRLDLQNAYAEIMKKRLIQEQVLKNYLVEYVSRERKREWFKSCFKREREEKKQEKQERNKRIKTNPSKITDLEFFSDPAILIMILDYLPLEDLLKFYSTCTYLRQFVQQNCTKHWLQKFKLLISFSIVIADFERQYGFDFMGYYNCYDNPVSRRYYKMICLMLPWSQLQPTVSSSNTPFYNINNNPLLEQFQQRIQRQFTTDYQSLVSDAVVECTSRRRASSTLYMKQFMDIFFKTNKILAHLGQQIIVQFRAKDNIEKGDQEMDKQNELFFGPVIFEAFTTHNPTALFPNSSHISLYNRTWFDVYEEENGVVDVYINRINEFYQNVTMGRRQNGKIPLYILSHSEELAQQKKPLVLKMGKANLLKGFLVFFFTPTQTCIVEEQQFHVLNRKSQAYIQSQEAQIDEKYITIPQFSIDNEQLVECLFSINSYSQESITVGNRHLVEYLSTFYNLVRGSIQ